uniref:Uncharacterized protein n=1 Tax=Mycena chlorophos TaxID=658473 RepID=A0ABQ0LVL2_MYCCL|nr:predicted protein [Mycena chlorophos]
MSSDASTTDGGFWADILKPGSSLQPQFIAILDGAFVSLLAILLALLFLTSGQNIHFYFLILITLGLWASVKWFVHELRNAAEKKDA